VPDRLHAGPPGIDLGAVNPRDARSRLRDTVAQFPTFSEAYLKGVEQLQ
jgi:hypothetical protein